MKEGKRKPTREEDDDRNTRMRMRMRANYKMRIYGTFQMGTESYKEGKVASGLEGPDPARLVADERTLVGVGKVD